MDMASNKLTVTGKVDAEKVRQRVEEKIHKKAEIISQPKKDAAGGDKKPDEKKPDEKSEKKPDDNKPKVVPLLTCFTRPHHVVPLTCAMCAANPSKFGWCQAHMAHVSKGRVL